MTGIIVQPDTTYNLMEIYERFEIPIEIEPNDLDSADTRIKKVTFINAVAQKAGQLAIERYTKFRKWKFRDDIPVTVDWSELQFDVDDWQWSSPVSKEPVAVTQRMDILKKKATKAYVLKMWFEVPEIRIVREDSGSEEGLVDEDALPTDLKKILGLPVNPAEETSNV